MQKGMDIKSWTWYFSESRSKENRLGQTVGAFHTMEEPLKNPGIVFTSCNFFLMLWTCRQLVFHHADPKSFSAVLHVTLSPDSIGSWC